jgi:hypothetical protein
VTVTEAPASATNTEATEDEGTEDFLIFFFASVGQEIQDDGGQDVQQVGEVGRDISSTPSGDVEMIEGQDQGKKIVLRGENFLCSSNFVIREIV